MAGIIITLIGVASFYLIPYIVKETFVISSGNLEQVTIELNQKQLILNVCNYISIGLMVFGLIISVVIGEIYAGYAVFESIRLKNFDKDNKYFDYSILCIVSCFLLPFVFLYYSMSQIRKEINFVAHDLHSHKNENLITEEEWHMKDFTSKLDYITYLLEMNIITKNEYKNLIKDVKNGYEENHSYDYKEDKFIGSDDFNKSIFDDKDIKPFHKENEFANKIKNTKTSERAYQNHDKHTI